MEQVMISVGKEIPSLAMAAGFLGYLMKRDQLHERAMNAITDSLKSLLVATVDEKEEITKVGYKVDSLHEHIVSLKESIVGIERSQKKS